MFAFPYSLPPPLFPKQASLCLSGGWLVLWRTSVCPSAPTTFTHILTSIHSSRPPLWFLLGEGGFLPAQYVGNSGASHVHAVLRKWVRTDATMHSIFPTRCGFCNVMTVLQKCFFTCWLIAGFTRFSLHKNKSCSPLQANINYI